MIIDEKFLEIKQYLGEGYMPMIDFNTWRVAVLKYCDELLPENITKMQKHNESDEVFILLQGSFTLFIGDGTNEAGTIHAQYLEPVKLYNVKKSTWHTHTLSRDAVVLIVENKNTCLVNSPEVKLSDRQRRQMLNLCFRVE